MPTQKSETKMCAQSKTIQKLVPPWQVEKKNHNILVFWIVKTHLEGHPYLLCFLCIAVIDIRQSNRKHACWHESQNAYAIEECHLCDANDGNKKKKEKTIYRLQRV